mgnify:CR=1 FL=1
MPVEHWPDAAKGLATQYGLADCPAALAALGAAMGIECDSDLGALGLAGATPRQLCCGSCDAADKATEAPAPSEPIVYSDAKGVECNQPLWAGTPVYQEGEYEGGCEDAEDEEVVLPNDAVFSMIGREAPLEFFRRSGVEINGELRAKDWWGFGLFMAFCFFVYNWKAGGELSNAFNAVGLFPYNVPAWINGLSAQAGNLSSLLGVLNFNLGKPGFWYSSVYTLLIIVFGYKRISRRRTPYIKWQTISLGAVQVVPLFLLPYIVLP